MQDRICRIDETSCNARPDHTLGHSRRYRDVRDESGLPPNPDVVRHLGEPPLRASTGHICCSLRTLVNVRLAGGS
jgi:hypothetical protein